MGYRSFTGWLLLFSVLTLGAEAGAGADTLTDGSQQLVVVSTATFGDSQGTLQRYERTGKNPWQPVGAPVPVLLGKGGMAWGRGVNPPEAGDQKKEGDEKTPAGLFRLGMVLGDAPQPPVGSHAIEYVQKNDHIAWIGHSNLPGNPPYNHLYVLPPGEVTPPWWEQEMMKPDTPAHAWMVLIEHNYPDSVADAGSAIFFHIQRSPVRRSAGCTVMPREAIEELIVWLDPAKKPLLAELPRPEYLARQAAWGLPPLQ
jgi:L,D-peptidoglycan transpeptidase YkuD (ErfK/YbiS/YcfS/YnhG family)